jgi:hypothetical protein
MSALLLVLAACAAAAQDDPAARVTRVLANRTALPPADLATAAPSLLPPRLIDRALTPDEVRRLLFLYSVPGPDHDVNVTTLTAMAGDRAKSFMALADVSKNGTGVVNREHEYPAWAARDDPAFNLTRYGDTPPPSVDRVFAAADWLGDDRHGVNVTAARRLGLGDPGPELVLALDADGDGRLNATELSARMPADTPARAGHPVYGYTPANGAALAAAALHAFDVDGDGVLNAEEAARYADAVNKVRGGGAATTTPDARRLAAALAVGGRDVLTDADVAAYTRTARASEAMGVVPAGVADAGGWFRGVTGGRGRVSVADFVRAGG